jgi:16S rRNA (adenine1518-N6/adenine1519-N6)-dimethyltransferase
MLTRPPATIHELRALLDAHGVRPKKSLGQNFLLDENVLRRIVRAADVAPDDLVVEVGPGVGTLTWQLALAARRVVTVELDQRMVAILRQTLAPATNVSIVHADVLKVDIAAMLDGEGQAGGGSTAPTPGPPPAVLYKVVANLPYYITSATIRKFLDQPLKPSLMVLMVQHEVAQRICAGPGDLSLLAVSVQFYAAPSLVLRLPAGAFYPPPKVDSALVRLDVRAGPRGIDNERFFRVVAAGFSQKRKQLRNSLAAGLQVSTAESEALLRRAGIDPQRRAQTLSLEDWERLANLPAA